jgi:hypothetical protein
LAEKYDISFNTLKDRAVGEHWADDRKKVLNKITSTAQQKVIKKRDTDCVRSCPSWAVCPSPYVHLCISFRDKIDLTNALVPVKTAPGV